MKEFNLLRRRLLIVFMAVLLSMSAAGSVIAANPTAAANSNQGAYNSVIGKIGIGSNRYMQLQNASLLANDNGQTLTFQAMIHNGGKEDISLSDYYIRVKSKAGISYYPDLAPQDKNQKLIPAGSDRTFQFYVSVDSTTKLSDLLFAAIQWDFSLDNFERVLGKIAVPKNYSAETPWNRKQEISLNGASLTTWIQGIDLYRNDQYILPTINLYAENSGNLSAVLPSLQFYIRTSNGDIFPMDASGLQSGLIMPPATGAQVTISGTLPATVNQKGLQLLVSRTITTTNSNTGSSSSSSSSQQSSSSTVLPIAIYQLKLDAKYPASKDNKYSFSTKDGTYSVQFDSLQRWPWNDQDLLTADFTLSNPTDHTLPIPQFTGKFQINHAVTVTAGTVSTDSISTLQPGQKKRIQLQGKIGFGESLESVEIFLQNGLSDIMHLTLSQLSNTPEVKSGQSYTLNDVGASYSVTVSSKDTFAGDSDDIIAAKVDMQNLEKRTIPLTNLTAQFVAPDGSVFPAEITSITQKIIPQAKASLLVWGNFPKGYDASGLQVLLGESVTAGHSTPSGGQPDAFTNAVIYGLPDEHTEVQSGLGQINLFPYTLNISNTNFPYFVYDKATNTFDLNFSFDYDFSKNSLVTANMDNRHVIVELLDGNGSQLLSQELDFVDTKSGNPVLKLGSDTMKLHATVSEISFNSSSYTVNIYSEFQSGHKKLLAQQKL
ncbi:hypothetical protein [Ferviditalea candida]|uniref:Uncharacterized protein n=1 Tax=Ferviditalea candida TaxID=3108399 RepID=A0ABU5ZC37_9BACL|nr:hypothetical protein [Paenibacillaceae bacterium T2]